jgi:quinol monooxygenase YgiN
MHMHRRSFVAGTAALAAAAASGKTEAKHGMFGLIGSMTAHPGKRDALVDILLEGVAGMPGCLSYVVANDPGDQNVIWITEVWQDREAHLASLSLPSVRDAITRGRPLIAAMRSVAETMPVGGTGLPGSNA